MTGALIVPGMEEQLIHAELLNLFNEKRDTGFILKWITPRLKDYLGCEALGIRIKDSHGNIPYVETAGFDESFLAREGSLCVRTDSCVCINIIEGKYDPGLPFYTQNGSCFATNLQNLKPVLDGMREGTFRGECVRRGWDVLGVVPIRFAHRHFGVIHFVSKEEGGIGQERFKFIENIASALGLFLHANSAASEKENEFLAVVQKIIHDLKNPLTAIQGFSELIAVKYLDRHKDDLRDMVERILRNAEYIEHLVNGFGEFAHYVGHKEERSEEIDLRKFVPGIVSDMDLPEKNNLEIKIDENIPAISYPSFSLRRILSNLIGNAVKYTPEDRRPKVEIGCEYKEDFYQVWVKDSGSGINADEVEKVFWPLYRSAEVKNIRGSGLGLSICRKLVEKHGGTIWVYSDKGKGSTFHFTIPK